MHGTIETPRLRLRPWTLDDLEAWHAIWGDPEVVWWGDSGTLEQCRAGLERLLARQRTWPKGLGWLAVVRREDDEVVGDVMLQPAPFVDGVEVGWHVRKTFWNRGYATEAAAALVDHAFGHGVLDRVYALVAERNAPSLRVAAKLDLVEVRRFDHAGLPHVQFERRAPAVSG